MIFKQKQPSPELSELLKRFDKANGVIQFIVFDLSDTEHLTTSDLHQSAAESTLYELNKLTNGRVKYQIEKAQSREISIVGFYGRHFDIHRQRIIGLHEGSLMLEEDTVIGTAIYVEQGLAYAFARPPYNLRIDWDETEALFVDFGEQLFNGFRDGLEIMQWSTDWSNYFDTGNEWWGSYFWTVHNTSQKFIVGVIASTTD